MENNVIKYKAALEAEHLAVADVQLREQVVVTYAELYVDGVDASTVRLVRAIEILRAARKRYAKARARLTKARRAAFQRKI